MCTRRIEISCVVVNRMVWTTQYDHRRASQIASAGDRHIAQRVTTSPPILLSIAFYRSQRKSDEPPSHVNAARGMLRNEDFLMHDGKRNLQIPLNVFHAKNQRKQAFDCNHYPPRIVTDRHPQKAPNQGNAPGAISFRPFSTNAYTQRLFV